MKKLLVFILSAILLTALLTACAEPIRTNAPATEATETTPEETRVKLTSLQIQEIALREAGADAEHLNSIDIHQGDYEGRECVSVMLIIRDRDYQFVLDVYTGEVLLSVFPEN